MDKMAPSEVAAAIVEALGSATEDVYPGEMAAGPAKGLAADAKAVEAELGQMLP